MTVHDSFRDSTQVSQDARRRTPPALAENVGHYVLGAIDLASAADGSGLSADVIASSVRERAAGLPATGAPAPRAPGEGPDPPRISVVVPVYNNAATLTELHRRLVATLSGLETFEIVFVDDGSADESTEVVRRIHARDPAVRLVGLSRNFGQQAALTAGLDAARGSAVVMLDADLQDPPELLADMVARWREGNQVVYAVRRNRKERLLKRLVYSGFYRVYDRLSEIDVAPDSGDFALLDGAVVEVLRSMPERSRFLRGLRSWSGFRQVSVEYDRPGRTEGKSQYSLRRLARLAVDGLVGFSSAPLQWAAFLGIAAAGLGLALLAAVVVLRLTDAALPLGWTSTISLVLLLGGVQLTTVGVVGAYIARIYIEVKQRPLYVVMERLE